MSKKKSKQRVHRGRPQSAPSRGRPRKGPPPRPAHQPKQPNAWQKLQSNRPLFFGSVAAAVLLVIAAAWFVFSRPKAAAAVPTATPTPEAAPTVAPMSWSEPPAMTIDTSRQYTATIVTEKGDITLQLYADKAPKTVNNFVFLAQQGFYDGVTFHRVISDFMAQTGDPTGTGTGGPGYTFEDEIDPSLQFDSEGILAMANTGQPGTNGSQFFITYGPATHLNGLHTIFGRVTSGMDVLRSLTPRDPEQNPTFDGDRIVTIQITEG